MLTRARRTGYRSQRVRITHLKNNQARFTDQRHDRNKAHTAPTLSTTLQQEHTALFANKIAKPGAPRSKEHAAPYLEYHTPTRAHSSVCKQICKTRSTALPGAHGPYLEYHTPTRATSSVCKEHRAPTRAHGSSQRRDAWVSKLPFASEP